MRRKKTAILLAIGLSVTAVLSTACGNSGATTTAAEDKPAVEEAAQNQQAEETAEAEKPAKEETGTAEVQAEQPLAAAGGQIASVKPAADQFH